MIFRILLKTFPFKANRTVIVQNKTAWHSINFSLAIGFYVSPYVKSNRATCTRKTKKFASISHRCCNVPISFESVHVKMCLTARRHQKRTQERERASKFHPEDCPIRVNRRAAMKVTHAGTLKLTQSPPRNCPSRNCDKTKHPQSDPFILCFIPHPQTPSTASITHPLHPQSVCCVFAFVPNSRISA